jgi:hypothetical protein
MRPKYALLEKVAGLIVTSENLQENRVDICLNTMWWPEKLGSLNEWMIVRNVQSSIILERCGLSKSF